MKKSAIVIGTIIGIVVILLIFFAINGLEDTAETEQNDFEETVSFSLEDLDSLEQELNYDIEDLGGL